MGKVPDYNLRAINKYNSKFDRVAVNLPIGSKERIKDLTGKSCNAYISALVLSDLDRIETERAAAGDPIGGEPETVTADELAEIIEQRRKEYAASKAAQPPEETPPIKPEPPRDTIPGDLDALLDRLRADRKGGGDP